MWRRTEQTHVLEVVTNLHCSLTTLARVVHEGVTLVDDERAKLLPEGFVRDLDEVLDAVDVHNEHVCVRCQRLFALVRIAQADTQMWGELADVLVPSGTHEGLRAEDKQALAVFLVTLNEVHDLNQGLACVA